MQLKIYAYICIGFYFISLFQFFTNTEYKQLFIQFINVGQGDASVINIPGVGGVLIDGGPDLSLEFFSSYVKSYPFCNLRYFYLSHFHSDHSYGLPNLIYRCSSIFSTINDIRVYSNSPNAFSKLISKNRYFSESELVNIRTSASDVQSYVSSKNRTVKFYILWPPEDYKTKDENDRSLVILVDIGDVEILLTGDVSGSILDEILTPKILSIIDAPLEIYKVPHHGSITGRSVKLLKLLNPQHCIISVGKNTFGHPNKVVMNDLLESGCKIHRTDLEGNVEFML